MTVTSWPEALDRYEASLDERARLLDLAEAEAETDPASSGDPWSPPTGLPAGGVPPEHRARAEALLARTDELGRQLAALRDSLPPLPTGRRPQARFTTNAAPRRVDRSL